MDTKCTKVKFSDEANALFYLDKLKRTSKRKVFPQSAYLCEKCLSWHLTSKLNIAIQPIIKPLPFIKPITESEKKKLTNLIEQKDNEIKNLKKKVAKLEKLLYDYSRKRFEEFE